MLEPLRQQLSKRVCESRRGSNYESVAWPNFKLFYGNLQQFWFGVKSLLNQNEVSSPSCWYRSSEPLDGDSAACRFATCGNLSRTMLEVWQAGHVLGCSCRVCPWHEWEAVGCWIGFGCENGRCRYAGCSDADSVHESMRIQRDGRPCWNGQICSGCTRSCQPTGLKIPDLVVVTDHCGLSHNSCKSSMSLWIVAGQFGSAIPIIQICSGPWVDNEFSQEPQPLCNSS